MNQRCSWVGTDPVMMAYHDTEWGVPLRDDRKLFEFMVLDAFQAGLSWRIVLHKRAGMRAAFVNFEPEKIAQFNEVVVEQLLANDQIIRNRQKITATINNARLFTQLQQQSGSFSNYLWAYVSDRPILNHWQQDEQIPSRTQLSDTISQDLQAGGFKFVGSTIVYAWLQAAGLVNDHLATCFRYRQLAAQA
ncbi:DNA-3-methyladenine glycosylase I [Candidatus Microgenomates bacterium]|nr:DNA-3-methyladenine glycosylase I [Candidatus Microgenomates bacterium]